MQTEANSITAKVSMPVAVVLEKRISKGSFWEQASWYLHAVLPGEHLSVDSEAGVKTGSTDKGDLFLWSGLRVTLYRDACERYWHALIGDKPQVYVVCQEDEADGTTEPALVTLDYDEALSYSETDGKVLSTEIPRELYQNMEVFVLDNYKPAEFKKRKRKKWTTEAPSGPGGKKHGRT